MIITLLTSWWFYVPIIAVLFLLTRRNHQRIKEIQSKKASLQSDQSEKATRVKKVAGKLSLASTEQGKQNTNKPQ